jgi:hypothetical protein
MTLEELAEKLGIELNDTTKGAIGAYLTAQTAGLKSNRDQLNRDVVRLKAELKAFDGIDAEELTATLEELQLEPGDLVERVRANPQPNGDAVKAAEAAAEAKYQRQIAKTAKERDAAIAERDAANRARCDSEVQRQLMDELAKKKGNSDLLLPMLRGRVKSEIGEDGKVTITVLAPNGDEMFGDAGAVATVGDLIESIRRDEKFGIAFEAEGGGSDAGHGGQRRPSGRTNPWAKATWNLTEQNKLKNENPALAGQLKRQAQSAA